MISELSIGLKARAPCAARARIGLLAFGAVLSSSFEATAQSATTAQSTAAPQSTAARCEDDDRYAEFDFWVGEWTVLNARGHQAGSNTISRMENGCLILESWRGARGGTGTSINYWDPVAESWTQVWVSSAGAIIRLTGGLQNDEMVLEGTFQNAAGATKPMRGTWTPQADGTVRQLIEISDDEGQTWQVWFAGDYHRKAGGA